MHGNEAVKMSAEKYSLEKIMKIGHCGLKRLQVVINFPTKLLSITTGCVLTIACNVHVLQS